MEMRCLSPFFFCSLSPLEFKLDFTTLMLRDPASPVHNFLLVDLHYGVEHTAKNCIERAIYLVVRLSVHSAPDDLLSLAVYLP